MHMVTPESLERLVERRRANRKSVAAPEGSVPPEVAMARLGAGRLEMLALGQQGLVIKRTPDYRFHVDLASLEAFGEGLGPDSSL